jgi:hypothetical protein
MIDRSVPFNERRTIWAQVDKYIPELRLESYDLLQPQLERELSSTPWGRRYTLAQAFPEPPGMEAYRAMMQQRLQEEERLREEQRRRDEMERAGSRPQ